MEESEIVRFNSFEDFSKKYQLGKIWLLLEKDFTETEVHSLIEAKVNECQMDIVIIDNNKYWVINR
jgi:hypothetical protein